MRFVTRHGALCICVNSTPTNVARVSIETYLLVWALIYIHIFIRKTDNKIIETYSENYDTPVAVEIIKIRPNKNKNNNNNDKNLRLEK